MVNVGLLISDSITSMATKDVLSSVVYFINSMGGTVLLNPRILNSTRRSLLHRFVIYTASKMRLLKCSKDLKRNIDAVLIPYPNVGNPHTRTNPAVHFDLMAIKRIKYKLGIPVILFIYDIPSLRSLPLYESPNTMRELQLEHEVFDLADAMMVFNEKSKQYLHKQFGLEARKIVCYEILDLYMPQCDKLSLHNYNNKYILQPIKVAIAGNLSEEYIGNYLKRLPYSSLVQYNLYGPYGNSIHRKDMLYQGILSGQKLLESMFSKNSFGLLIYNDQLSPYLRYTPTTKLSLYLLAGLPVVSHRKYEYPSQLIKKYKIGSLFKDISQIPVILEKTYNSRRYWKIRNNVLHIRSSIYNGNHFKRALLDALNRL